MHINYPNYDAANTLTAVFIQRHIMKTLTTKKT